MIFTLPGNYKGKVISEKEYKKLESADKESGYSWRAVSQDGDVIYLDGASHRASNWLRFLNCARGQCEENVLVRNIPGMKMCSNSSSIIFEQYQYVERVLDITNLFVSLVMSICSRHDHHLYKQATYNIFNLP